MGLNLSRLSNLEARNRQKDSEFLSLLGKYLSEIGFLFHSMKKSSGLLGTTDRRKCHQVVL